MTIAKLHFDTTHTSLNDTFNAIDFKPPFWLRNPHLQTILPKFTMPGPPDYRRDLALDSLNESHIAYDFLDADEPTLAGGERYQIPLVVLFHGLEGSSHSHYARTMAHYVKNQGWHYVVVHYRSCGGVPASGHVLYEAGDTLEIHHALQYLATKYQTIHTIGTSMGGSVLAKYMGEYQDDAICASASIVSAPLDLASSSIAMQRLFGRKIYTPYLLNPITEKVLQHHLSEEEIRGIKACKSISDFDQAFTAPRHGYRSKNDYYHQASAMPYLHKITKPTLIITAKDDPFLGITPTAGDVSDDVVLCEPKYGGHIGFMRLINKKLDATWFPEVSMQFYRSI